MRFVLRGVDIWDEVGRADKGVKMVPMNGATCTPQRNTRVKMPSIKTSARTLEQERCTVVADEYHNSH